jgi:DNA (cytosine-5)-methyltransferase 1
VARRLTAIDLFAGAGGASAGLRAAGFDVVAAVENDPDAAATYRLNHPGAKLVELDIRRVTPRDLLRKAGLRPRSLTLLQACPPCQAWSTLGTGSPEDPRNALLSVVDDFIGGMLPKAFIIENVPGLKADARLARLVEKAAALGYAARAYVVDASTFSVPQRRKRLIVIGARGVSQERLLATLEEMLPPEFDRSRRTVQDAIGHLPTPGGADDIHRHRKLGELTQRRVDALPPAGRWRDLPLELQLECHRGLNSTEATTAYGRMAADDVAPTLTTRCTTVACGTYVHPTANRGITLREAALLQTFPADYKFSGGYNAIERQIGNAIPVRLAQAAATAALSLIERRPA